MSGRTNPATRWVLSSGYPYRDLGSENVTNRFGAGRQEYGRAGQRHRRNIAVREADAL
jgi:hypothetical protein